ncbi:MAG: CPBP family intramembrane metalloprotease [Oscillospiraceae bacterium]|nr:CPBP family intramembrane metalloprotease [Oscillospiraceae bacterium]
MNMKKLNIEVLLWTNLVLILSFLCYFPMFLEQKGIHIFRIGSYLKYLFVTIPALISIFFNLKHKHLKKWFYTLFSEKVKFQAIISCIILGSIGLSFSIIYCLIIGENDLFKSNYPSVLAVVINCSYLFFTALIEEIAWRGFLLNKISAEKGKKIALVYVGVVWAIWHIPMWAIRNSLEFREILIYFILTILISFILGMLFYKYKNILIVSLSHMIFNTCFITPVKYNCILLGCILILSILISNKKGVII